MRRRRSGVETRTWIEENRTCQGSEHWDHSENVMNMWYVNSIERNRRWDLPKANRKGSSVCKLINAHLPVFTDGQDFHRQQHLTRLSHVEIVEGISQSGQAVVAIDALCRIERDSLSQYVEIAPYPVLGVATLNNTLFVSISAYRSFCPFTKFYTAYIYPEMTAMNG